MTPRAPHRSRELSSWETFIAWVISIVIGVPLFLAVIFVIGAGIERQAQISEQTDRCLKQATNGYEIRQCERGY